MGGDGQALDARIAELEKALGDAVVALDIAYRFAGDLMHISAPGNCDGSPMRYWIGGQLAKAKDALEGGKR